MSDSQNAGEVEKLRSERDAYQSLAMTAESNELTLHRRLSPYLDSDIERKDAEIAHLKRRISELAQDTEKAGESDG